MQNNANAL